MHSKLRQAVKISVPLRSGKDRSRKGYEGPDGSTRIVLHFLEHGR